MDNNQPPNQPSSPVQTDSVNVQTAQAIPADPGSAPYAPPQTTAPPAAPASRKPVLIIAVAVILVILASVGGIVWMNMAATRSLQQLVQSQVKDLTDLEKSYKSVRTILDESDAQPDASTTNLLKTRPSKISDVNADVLGAEEDLNIGLNRRLADQYKKGRASLQNVSGTNTKIAGVYAGNPIVKPFLPDATGLINKTKDFTTESDALLAYMNQINSLEISSKTLGYQIGLALQESIIRNADSESVAQFKIKVNELNDIYADYKAIDISDLPEDLKKSHNEGITSFDKDVAVFYELVTALERKDALTLQQAIQSLIIQSQSASTASEIEVRNFWNEHETINAATTLKNEWQRFGEDNLGIAF